MDEELEGFESGETRQKVWRTFDARPRFGTNYAGMRNRIAILSEAYSYLDFERRVAATEAFVEEIMRFVAANGDDDPLADVKRRCRVDRRERPARSTGHRVRAAIIAEARGRARRRHRQEGESAVRQADADDDRERRRCRRA